MWLKEVTYNNFQSMFYKNWIDLKRISAYKRKNIDQKIFLRYANFASKYLHVQLWMNEWMNEWSH